MSKLNLERVSEPDMRTALKKVRGLGSSHEGTDHFWKQRVTGVALVFLTLFFVGLIVALNGAGYEATIASLRNPFVALILAVMMITGLIHMRLGMQSVIEDYVHSEGAKLGCLILSTFFTVAVGAMALFALLKITLGA